MGIARPILPDMRKVEGYRIAILARSGHGKSYLARVLVEKIIDTYSLPAVIIEPVTEYESLLEIYPGVVFRDEDAIPLEPLTMAEVSVRAPVVVINYENTPMSRARSIISEYLDRLISVAKSKRTPFLLVIEEAHLLAPQRYTKNTLGLIEMMEYIAKVGRKLGINYILITQRPASLNKDVLSQINILFAGSFSNPRDMKAVSEIAETLGVLLEKNELSHLERGEFVEICCGRKTIIKSPQPKSRHLGGTPTTIKPIQIPQIDVEELMKKAKERLEKEKKYMKIRVEEYEDLLNEIKALRKRVVELEKQRDELRLKLETIQLIAEKLAVGGEQLPRTTSDTERGLRAILSSLPQLEQCIYNILLNEPTGRMPLSILARKCGSTRKSSRFLQALRRLKALGLIEYSTRKGRAWLK